MKIIRVKDDSDIKIKDCSECPYCLRYLKTPINLCAYTKILDNRLVNYTTIPDWCELEDEEGKEEKK